MFFYFYFFIYKKIIFCYETYLEKLYIATFLLQFFQVAGY